MIPRNINRGSTFVIVLISILVLFLLITTGVVIYFYMFGSSNSTASSVVLPGGPQPSVVPLPFNGETESDNNEPVVTAVAVVHPTVMPSANERGPIQCLNSVTKPTDFIVENGQVSTTTVDNALKSVSAYCSADILYAQNKQKILLYRLGGCSGESPEQIKTLIADQAVALTKLKQSYWVLEVACNPHVLP